MGNVRSIVREGHMICGNFVGALYEVFNMELWRMMHMRCYGVNSVWCILWSVHTHFDIKRNMNMKDRRLFRLCARWPLLQVLRQCCFRYVRVGGVSILWCMESWRAYPKCMVCWICSLCGWCARVDCSCCLCLCGVCDRVRVYDAGWYVSSWCGKVEIDLLVVVIGSFLGVAPRTSRHVYVVARHACVSQSLVMEWHYPSAASSWHVSLWSFVSSWHR